MKSTPKSHAKTPSGDRSVVLRIIDANANRLREALRVIEEHFRFGERNKAISARLKAVRHSLQTIEWEIGRSELLAARDIAADPLAVQTRPEEAARSDIGEVLIANWKRGQEASRVIEEYAKAGGWRESAETAKAARFALYDLEKAFLEK